MCLRQHYGNAIIVEDLVSWFTIPFFARSRQKRRVQVLGILNRFTASCSLLKTIILLSRDRILKFPLTRLPKLGHGS
jgi:hypothetical protein